MKKILLALAASALSLAAQAFEPVEGEHFVALKQAHEPLAPVLEIYSVYCPFCMKYERAILPGLKQSFGAQLGTAHLSSKGEFGAEATRLIAVVETVAPERAAALKQALYSALIEEQRSFADAAALRAFALEAAGISEAEFQAALPVREVREKIDAWNTVGEAVAPQVGVPAFVVDGRYAVKLSAMRNPAMLEATLRALLAK